VITSLTSITSELAKVQSISCKDKKYDFCLFQVDSSLKFRIWFKYGLKAQKLLAQGIALGIMAISKAPYKGKSFVYCQVFESFCPLPLLYPSASDFQFRYAPVTVGSGRVGLT